MPRISKFDTKMRERVIEKIASGDYTLRKVAAEEGISDSLIIKTALNDAEFGKQYAHAINIGADIAFERLRDECEEEPLLHERGGIDSGWVAWKRLQIDTKKWALSKRNPKKYGDKQIVSGDPDAPLEVVKRVICDI